MELKRGVVVKHLLDNKTLGVIEEVATNYALVIWFNETLTMQDAVVIHQLEPLADQATYALDAAAALGDVQWMKHLYAEQRERADKAEERLNALKPLLGQYPAEAIERIVSNLLELMSTGKFDPETAIRYWSRPHAVYGSPQVEDVSNVLQRFTRLTTQNSIFYETLPHAGAPGERIERVVYQMRPLTTPPKIEDQVLDKRTGWLCTVKEVSDTLITLQSLLYPDRIVIMKVDEMQDRLVSVVNSSTDIMDAAKKHTDRLTEYRLRFDAILRLDDSQWQAILDHCSVVDMESSEPNVFWTELDRCERRFRNMGLAVLNTLRRMELK
jgi:hypothetical protein